jgi:hypothetical protein
VLIGSGLASCRLMSSCRLVSPHSCHQTTARVITLPSSVNAQAATGRDPGAIADLLWQLVAASAHIIVPVATYNLKVRACFRQSTFTQSHH